MVMVIAELEDGREKIFAKENKPIAFDLSKTNDRTELKLYKRAFIRDKIMCYNEDLTLIDFVSEFEEDDRSFVKSIRYEPYDENLKISLRTFCIRYGLK